MIANWLATVSDMIHPVVLPVLLATATLLALTSVRNQHVSDRARANVDEAIHKLPTAKVDRDIVAKRLAHLKWQNEQFNARYKTTRASFLCLVATLCFFAASGVLGFDPPKAAPTAPAPVTVETAASASGETVVRSGPAAPIAPKQDVRQRSAPDFALIRAVAGLCGLVGTLFGLLGLWRLVKEFMEGPDTLANNNLTLDGLEMKHFLIDRDKD